MWTRGVHTGTYLFFLWCTCSWCFLQAKAQEQIVVEHSGPSVREAVPDTVITLVFKVTNKGLEHWRLQPHVTLPASWRLVLPVPALELDPGSDALQFLSISIPSSARAGSYGIFYSAAPNHRSAKDSVRVKVGTTRRVTVREIQAPDYVAAGEVYRATFLISNEGNVPEDVKLSVHDHQNGPARLDVTQLSLAPFSSRQVTLLMETSPALMWKHTRTGSLIADVEGTHERHAAYAVDVIPRFAQLSDPYRRLPSELSATSIGQGGHFYPQIELQASGHEVFHEGDHLELVARGPNRLRTSTLGEIDAYSLRYQAKRFSTQIGDGTYALTPLTEPGTRAFGGHVEGTFGRWTLGTYAAQTRYYAPVQEQFGSFVRYAPGKRTSISANYLANQGLDTGHLLSALAEAEPLANTKVSVEVGADAAHSTDNMAAGVTLEGETSRFDYSGRYMKVGNQFAGSYRGTEFWSASGHFQLAGRLALEGSFFNQARSALNDLILASPQEYVLYRAGARYAGRIGLFYVYKSQNENEILGRSDQGLQLDLRLPFKTVSFVSRLETGKRRSQALPEPHRYYAYDVSAYLHLGRNRSLYASVGGDRNINAFTGDPQRRFSFNAGGNVTIAKRLRADFILSHSHYRYPGAFDFTSGDFQASYTFPFGHRLVARARWFGFGQPGTGEDQAFSIRYVVPINLPLGRSHDSGTVRGRIYDAGTGTGMEGVLINLGNAAVLSGPNGLFSFRGIAPEDYPLSIEGVDVEQVTENPVPAHVQVQGGQIVLLDVGLTPSASLTGRVATYGEPSDGIEPQAARDPALAGQPGVLIEARSGEEAQRRLTDRQGRFNFQNLRPGTWTVSVAGGDLPDSYRLERASLTLDLAPGDMRDLAFRLVPVRRKVEIIDGGELKLGGSDGKSVPKPGQQQPVAPKPAVPPAGAPGVHVVSPSDVSLFDISRQAYGTDRLWPKIWMANQEVIPNPDILPEGVRLAIPPKAPLTPAEKAARTAYYGRKSGKPDENVTPEPSEPRPATPLASPVDEFNSCAFCRYLNHLLCTSTLTCQANSL
ncbi:MAG TPA: hypothetical protein VFG50_01940 [Rhodothermales bacterium]|nr:hypothetical protein [Rhodothermales bacterium]